jgi:hypothetical protein
MIRCAKERWKVSTSKSPVMLTELVKDACGIISVDGRDHAIRHDGSSVGLMMFFVSEMLDC